MLHRDGANEAQVKAYIKRYGLGKEHQAERSINFIRQTGNYVFTYWHGWQMLNELFEKRGEKLEWFKQLLCQPVTPGQVRRWIAADR